MAVNESFDNLFYLTDSTQDSKQNIKIPDHSLL